MFAKVIPASSQEVHISNCALIEFLFWSISIIFLKTRLESTIAGKGLKYPFSPVKHIFDFCISSLQFFKSEIYNSALQSSKMQMMKRKYLKTWNIVTDNLSN